MAKPTCSATFERHLKMFIFDSNTPLALIVRADFKQDLNIWQLERAICSGQTFVNCNSTLKFEPYKNQELCGRLVENCKPENVPTFFFFFKDYVD